MKELIDNLIKQFESTYKKEEKIKSGPARRHLCELCNKVFECHLCEIDYTHPVHEARTLRDKMNIYICLYCSKRFKLNFLCTVYGTRKESIIRIWNYTTGRLVRKENAKRRRDNIKYWREII